MPQVATHFNAGYNEGYLFFSLKRASCFAFEKIYLISQNKKTREETQSDTTDGSAHKFF